jgi:hypothetical protein
VEAIIYYFVGGTPREECEKNKGIQNMGMAETEERNGNETN